MYEETVGQKERTCYNSKSVTQIYLFYFKAKYIFFFISQYVYYCFHIFYGEFSMVGSLFELKKGEQENQCQGGF